ncbi:MAG: VanZ family protein [Thalassotalea sp.]
MSILINFISRFYLLITVLLLTAITLLSLWPIAHLPAVPGTDKTHHFIAYGALVFPAAIKCHSKLWFITLAFAIYSGVIELIQPFVNRYGEWLDLAANSAGLLCGIVAANIILLLAKKRLINKSALKN